MKTQMMVNIQLNAMALTEMGVNEFKAKISPDTFIAAKLQIVTCTGQIIELDVNDLLKVETVAVDPIDGIEIYQEDEFVL